MQLLANHVADAEMVLSELQTTLADQKRETAVFAQLQSEVFLKLCDSTLLIPRPVLRIVYMYSPLVSGRPSFRLLVVWLPILRRRRDKAWALCAAQ